MSLNTSTDRAVKILENKVLTLSVLLNYETVSHQHTRDILAQIEARSAEFERLCNLQSAQLQVMNINLTQAENRVNQLKHENERLNLAMNHLVPARVSNSIDSPPPPSSDYQIANDEFGDDNFKPWGEPEDYCVIEGAISSSTGALGLEETV